MVKNGDATAATGGPQIGEVMIAAVATATTAASSLFSRHCSLAVPVNLPQSM